jgi:hypothetical protein
MRRRAKTFSIVLVAALSLGTGIARADSARVTRGDAEAIFQARLTGDFAIRVHSTALAGAPAQDGLGRILPFHAFDGTHYCSLDWHSLSLFFYDFGDQAFVAAELAPYVYAWTLDGSPIATESTAVKRVDPVWMQAMWGTPDGWGAGNGALLAPDALAVGTHTAHLVVTDVSSSTVVFDNGITFVVDRPGTGACA